jgi:hypothetical protein
MVSVGRGVGIKQYRRGSTTRRTWYIKKSGGNTRHAWARSTPSSPGSTWTRKTIVILGQRDRKRARNNEFSPSLLLCVLQYTCTGFSAIKIANTMKKRRGWLPRPTPLDPQRNRLLAIPVALVRSTQGKKKNQQQEKSFLHHFYTSLRPPLLLP